MSSFQGHVACRNLSLTGSHLYGIRYPRQPSFRVTLAKVTLNLFLCKINQPFTLRMRTSLGGQDNSGGRVVSPCAGKKRDICIFNYSIRVMNNHAGTTLTQQINIQTFTYKRSIKLPGGSGGGGCLVYPRPYNWGHSLCSTLQTVELYFNLELCFLWNNLHTF